MTDEARVVSMLALPLIGMSAAASAAPSDDCSVLVWAFREARTEFPALKSRQFGGAQCTYRTNEFKCAWGFPSDRYGDAQTQEERLERCTAAQPNAKLLAKGHQQATFQLDPETVALVRGPDSNDGDWAIRLKITTTANWK